MYWLLRGSWIDAGSSTYWLDVHICKLSDQFAHHFGCIVDSFKQHRLVPNDDIALKEEFCCFSCDPGYLIWMVEMGMDADVFPYTPGFVGDINEYLGPFIVRVENPAWCDCKPFCCETNALHMLYSEETK